MNLLLSAGYLEGGKDFYQVFKHNIMYHIVHWWTMYSTVCISHRDDKHNL